jgi:tetratricopeptide (TPR) repeat protein
MPVDKTAERRLREALEANPEDGTLHNDLGNELLSLGETAAAIECYRTAIGLMPGRPEIHFNLANALAADGESEAALASYHKSIELDPASAGAHTNLGNLLRKLKRPAEALESYRRAIYLNPQDAAARFNIGTALIDLHRVEEALVWFEQAANAPAPHIPAMASAGEALLRLGRVHEALRCLGAARRLQPSDPGVRLSEGLALLMLGHFQPGWECFEARLEDRRVRDALPAVTGSIWRGKQEIAGRTMLVYAEQGIGDTIQFVRYVPLLRARGARVVLTAHAPLLSLLRPLADCIIDMNARPPAYDLHCPLLSLPLAFDTRLNTIPAEVPYLRADAEHIERWRRRMGASRRRRVGIAFSGNVQHALDALRSIPAADFAPILQQKGIEFHLLQKHIRPHDVTALAEFAGVQTHTEELHDFADTAALISLMDLVISVDTSVAHLAGAMGKPVWIMLQFDADFRWLRERNDSPWYPTARLFRQAAMREWKPVVDAVAAALAEG